MTKQDDGVFSMYRNKPKAVCAVQFTDKYKDRIHGQLTGQYAVDFEDGSPVLKVMTIHGEVAIVRLGDWIVKEPESGFYYPVKNDIFLKDYTNEQ